MELIGAAAVVRLPARLTAVSVAQFAVDLQSAFESSGRVVQLSGAGGGTFCTGLALDGDPATLSQTQEFARVLSFLAKAPRPTLAVVDGEAIGGGLGLAAACDWIVAASNATFGLPELLWGVMPAMIWPFVVGRMGESHARRWTVAARSHSAAEALAAGLIDEVVEAAALEKNAGRAIRRLSRLEPNALASLRQWAGTVAGRDLDRLLKEGAALTAGMAASPQARARWEAFRAGEAPWIE